jgi:hypothetical protein
MSAVASDDRNGYKYQLLDFACSQKPNSAWNPRDAALTCAKSPACEISALPTALFLTQTSTSQVTIVHQGSPASTPQPVTPAETAQPIKETTSITSSNVPTSLMPVPTTNNLIPALTTNGPSGAAPSIRASTALISSSTGSGVIPPSTLVLSATHSSNVQMFTSSAAEVPRSPSAAGCCWSFFFTYSSRTCNVMILESSLGQIMDLVVMCWIVTGA